MGWHLLREEDGRREVVAKPQDIRDLVIPLKIGRIDRLEVAAGNRLGGRMQHVESLVDELTELTKALVHRSNVGRLLTRSLQRCTCSPARLSAMMPQVNTRCGRFGQEEAHPVGQAYPYPYTVSIERPRCRV